MSSGSLHQRSGFTLIELLTVITILAILATLLMTTLSSAKRKAREAVCISNLHQIGIALHLYLDDFGKRPPDLQTLASAKYLGDGKILTCPADRTPFIPKVESIGDKSFASSPTTVSTSPALHVSYQSPLAWPDEAWNRLLEAQTRAGIVVCQFHDPARSSKASLGANDGVILRGLLDGTVVHRHIFPVEATSDAGIAVPPSVNRAGAPPTSSLVANSDNAAPLTAVPPWDFFSDDPPP